MITTKDFKAILDSLNVLKDNAHKEEEKYGSMDMNFERLDAVHRASAYQHCIDLLMQYDDGKDWCLMLSPKELGFIQLAITEYISNHQPARNSDFGNTISKTFTKVLNAQKDGDRL